MVFILCHPLTGGAAPSSVEKKLQSIDFQLRWMHQFQFAGYYAAIEQGYYREVGLEVRLHEGRPGRTPVGEVLSGRAQYGEGNSEVLYERLQGNPLLALAAIFQHSPSVLLARADAGIRTPHDLVGKTIMLMNGRNDSDFHAMLLREGIKLDSINVVQSSYDITDLIDGRVAALNAYLTNEPFYLEQKEIDYVVINPSHYGIDYYSDILFTTEQEARDNPQRVVDFRDATLRGWRYAMDHPVEIIDLLIDKYKVTKSREHLVFEARAMRALMHPDVVEIGHMNSGRWQSMVDAFKMNGMVSPEASLEDFVYDPNPRLWAARLKETIVYSGLLIGAILTILMASIIVQRRLRKEIALRKDYEEQLSRTNDLLRRTGELAKVGGWEIDFVNDRNTWTEEAARIRELPPGSVLTYEESIAAYDEDSQAQLKAGKERALKDGTPWDLELPLTTASGKRIWIRTRGEAILRDGKPIFLTGILQDISDQKKAELALARTNTLLKSIIETSPLRIFWKDRDSNYLGCNPAFAHDAGFTDSFQLIGKDDYQMAWAEEAEKIRAQDLEVIQSGCSKLFIEEELVRPEGGKRWISSSKIPLLDDARETIGVLCFYDDITERKLASLSLLQRTSELEMHNRILRDITQGAPLPDMLAEMARQIEALHPEMLCAVFLLDASGRRLQLAAAPSLPQDFLVAVENIAVDALEGASGAAVYSNELITIDDVQCHPNWRQYREVAKLAGLNSAWSQPIRAKDGVLLGAFTIYQRSSGLPNPSDVVRIENYANLAVLIIERHRSEEMIRNLAFFDTLTALPNRRLLADRLNLAMALSKRSGRYGALMFLDLDDFKPLNDTHGHAVGDLLLIQVAQRLSICVREIDTVGRFGGDEFVVMLSELDTDRAESIDQARRVAEKIRLALSEPYVLALNHPGAPDERVEHRCSASIGVVLFYNHEASLDEIVKWADMAMYRAKEAGRNCVFFEGDDLRL